MTDPRQTAKMRGGLGQTLIGEELSGVGFVRDYVELYFDGPVFRMFGNVSFESADRSAASGLESQLRSLIGSTVTDIRDSENSFEIEFGGGSKVSVQTDPRISEYAHLITYPDNRMVLWRTK